MKATLLFSYLLVLSLTSYAQPSPGGIGNSQLTAWFRATDLPNGNVTAWTSTFPTGASAITANEVGGAPYPVATNTPVGNVSNYNTTIYFDTTDLSNDYRVNGIRGFESTARLNLLDNLSGRSTFIGNYYYATHIDNNDHMLLYNEDAATNSFTRCDAIQFRQLNAVGRIAIGRDGNRLSSNACRNWTRNFLPTTVSCRGNRNSSTSMESFVNTNRMTSATRSQSSGVRCLRIGYGVNTTSQYKGFLNEFIFLRRNLSNNELQRVETYLAIKYGMTLPSVGFTRGDYLATDGMTILWEAANGRDYHNDVIGIGRDDVEDLLQKQSHSFDDITRLYVDNLAMTNNDNRGSITRDISYVMIGHNAGALCETAIANAEVPTTIVLGSRIEREWKVTKTNFSDAVSMDITLAGTCTSYGGLVTGGDLQLLVDDDGDFSNGGTTAFSNGDGTGVRISISGSTVTIAGLTDIHLANNATSFISLGINPRLLNKEDITYEGQCVNNELDIKWMLVDESSIWGFCLEESVDAVHFEKIKEGSKDFFYEEEKSYKYKAYTPDRAPVYYRLKVIDIQGNYSYTPIFTVSCKEEVKEVMVFPNPFDQILEIHNIAVDRNQKITCILYDQMGRIVTKIEKENVDTHLSIKEFSNVPKGMYILELQGDQWVRKTKLLKQ